MPSTQEELRDFIHAVNFDYPGSSEALDRYASTVVSHIVFTLQDVPEKLQEDYANSHLAVLQELAQRVAKSGAVDRDWTQFRLKFIEKFLVKTVTIQTNYLPIDDNYEQTRRELFMFTATLFGGLVESLGESPTEIINSEYLLVRSSGGELVPSSARALLGRVGVRLIFNITSIIFFAAVLFFYFRHLKRTKTSELDELYASLKLNYNSVEATLQTWGVGKMFDSSEDYAQRAMHYISGASGQVKALAGLRGLDKLREIPGGLTHLKAQFESHGVQAGKIAAILQKGLAFQFAGPLQKILTEGVHIEDFDPVFLGGLAIATLFIVLTLKDTVRLIFGSPTKGKSFSELSLEYQGKLPAPEKPKRRATAVRRIRGSRRNVLLLESPQKEEDE